ncbi:hypothetical protein BX616_003047 [Lobosporangium transversale]|nr:hypothetical protein BX616_003047 [Lobosporangium transversale]
MIRAYESAKYDIVWVQDSNVYVDPGCMGRSVDKMMKPGVGLVHHLPFGVGPKTLGSELELMFLGTVHAKMYLFINWTGLASCVVGKSSLYRRSDLDRVGGLAKFGKYMAEDNLIATEIFNMGYKHEMTSDLAYQSLGSMTPSDYFLRRARWTRIRKYTVTAATIVEPFIEMIGCGLVASYGFNLLWQTHFLNFLAFHIVIWFLVDLSMFQALSGVKVDNLRGFLMAWSLRELAALPLYIYAVAGSTVDWRDQPFLLKRDGTVIPLALATPATSVTSAGTSVDRTNSSVSASYSVPSSPTSAAFAQLANTVVPPSAQTSLRNFFRRPAVISVVSSILAVIHFVVDILIKSQRNGNEEEDEQRSEDELIEETLYTREENSEAGIRNGTRDGPVLKLQKVPLNKKSSYRSSSGSSDAGIDGSRAEYRMAKDDLYDADDSSAAENGTLPRRSARIKKRLQLKVVEQDHSHDVGSSPLHPRENGRRSTDEDALSKAVEPYLSDSLSRRGRIRRELSSSSQYLS